MVIKVSGVKWSESVKVVLRKNVVVLQVMTKARRFFRSTSFELSKKEALKLANELQRKASSGSRKCWTSA
jgi:hypothetical protein